MTLILGYKVYWPKNTQYYIFISVNIIFWNILVHLKWYLRDDKYIYIYVLSPICYLIRQVWDQRFKIIVGEYGIEIEQSQAINLTIRALLLPGDKEIFIQN